MNAALERFVATLHREHGDELLLETGRPIRLRKGSLELNLLAQDVRTDQIDMLLREVAPSDFAWIFERDGETVFPYQAPTGAVSIRIQRMNGRVSASLKPRPSPPGRTTTRFPAITVMPSATPIASPAVPAPMPDASAPSSEPSPENGSALQVFPARRSVSSVVPGYHDVQKPIVREVPTVVGEPVAPPMPPPLPPDIKLLHRIDPLLAVIFQVGASDLHLTANNPPRLRKDGDIAPVPGFTDSISTDNILEWLMEIAPAHAREHFQNRNDADFAYELPGLARFRVNVFRDRRGVGGVLRTIPTKILTAEQLGLPAAVRELCTLQKGLVVVTGPTGSGKSTTLAAMVDHINATRSDHIITIEDPLEFIHESKRCLVHQREIHTHTESFSSALRAALREDPNVVLVGELRDLETVSIAIETAETGHLVFGTLHTNSAVSTVDRIVDQFPPDRQSQIRVMLSESLRGVIAQTLCKKSGGGRVAAHEILLGTPAIANLIREGKTYQIPSTMQTNRALGMQTLNDALMQLVKDRVVEAPEAYRRAVSRADMRAMLEAASFRVE